MGWPKGRPKMSFSMSLVWIQKHVTTIITQPKTPHMEMEVMMPMGMVRVALVHSSDMCTHESKAPMVQMAGNHACDNCVQPMGKDV